MMSRRQFGAKLYYQLSLDKLVPRDHLLRGIAGAADFSFLSSHLLGIPQGNSVIRCRACAPRDPNHPQRPLVTS